MKTPILEEDGRVYFLIEVLELEPHYIKFNIHEVTAWSNGKSKKPVDDELYLEGYIKWDGCSHITFGDDDGYIHICGADGWRHHVQLMVNIFSYASQNIKKFDR